MPTIKIKDEAGKWVRIPTVKGDAFTYKDFTPEQLENLRGPQGVQGIQGPQGSQGPQGIQGPEGPQGIPGEKGADGTGVNILGHYETLGELQAAHPTGKVGDAYMVGANLYVWNTTSSTWVDVGNIRGPQGIQGPAGPQGSQGEVGPEGKQGPQGIQGESGKDGYTPVKGTDYFTAEDINSLNIPRKTSDLTNDSNFATESYVDNEIATFDFIKVVDELPETGLVNRIYFVPKADAETQDLFDEYVWVNGAWEWITSKQLEVDLTNYVMDEEYVHTDNNYTSTEKYKLELIESKATHNDITLNGKSKQNPSIYAPASALSSVINKRWLVGANTTTDFSSANTNENVYMQYGALFSEGKKVATESYVNDRNKFKNMFNKYVAPMYTMGATYSIVNDEIVATSKYAGTDKVMYMAIGKGLELAGKTITVSGSWVASASNNGAIELIYCSENGASISRKGTITESGGSLTVTINASSFSDFMNTVAIVLYSNYNGTGAIGDTVTYTNIQVEENSSASEYEPYYDMEKLYSVVDTLYANGSDYAECFEWEDGNPENEDRRSLFVSIVNGTRKIRKAMIGDDVLGITSIDASVVGNAAYKDNPAYSVVGMVGVIRVKDNGQCEVGSYVIPGDDGIAIPSGNDAGYKVTARYSEDLIEVLLAHDSEMISRLKDDVHNANEIAISPTEPTTGEEVWIQKGKNLFDLNYTKFEYSIDGSTGNVVSAVQNCCGENYIEVLPNKQYTFEVKSIAARLRLSEYKNDKTHIKRNEVENASYITITTTNETKYIRWSMRYNENESSLTQVKALNPQIQEGTEIMPNKIYTKNDNGVYEEFYDETNLEVYSTSEQRIGTWMGKPLYRKVFEVPTTKISDTNTTVIAYELDNNMKVVKMEGFIETWASKYGFPISYNGVNSGFRLRILDTVIQLIAGTDTAAESQITTGNVIVEYTKTTD